MFYVRKSIKVGPVRFNLSKSGVGTSIGVKGARFGVGPRGSYVHVGGNGISYRQYLAPARRGAPQRRPDLDRPPVLQPVPDVGKQTAEDLVEIESADVSQLTSASLSDFVRGIEETAKKTNLWPWLIAMLFFAVVVVSSQAGGAAFPVYVGGTVLIALAAWRWWQVLPKFRSVVFYDFDEGQQASYQHLIEAAGQLADSKRIWNVTASGNVLDKKYHAGAGVVIDRQKVNVSLEAPKRVSTNTPVTKIPAGRETLYLFPDHLHVVSPSGHAAICYSDLSVTVGAIEFVEAQSVPSDARIVGRTWRYVNRNGGPDRRFKDNHELPVAEYAVLELTTTNGLRELFYVSAQERASEFLQALERQKASIAAAAIRTAS